MTNDTHIWARTQTAHMPADASVSTQITDTDLGEVLLELDMVGSDNRALVLAMSGTVRQVREDLDTLMGTLENANLRLAEREVLSDYEEES